MTDLRSPLPCAAGSINLREAVAVIAKKLGLWSGVGLVIANMIGAGVLISTGFAAMDLAPSHILLAWIVGGVAALAGARAYAAVAAKRDSPCTTALRNGK